MSDLAFIVDGHMEQKIVQTLCPSAKVVKLDCNGRDVDLCVAARKAASLIRLMPNRRTVIVVFDRESRPITSEEVETKIESELKSLAPGVDLYVASPDRMIENWILADIRSVNLYYGTDIPQENFEGHVGKGKLRRLIAKKAYSETEDGPILFKKVRPETAEQNSPSFRRMRQKLSEIGCWWLSQ